MSIHPVMTIQRKSALLKRGIARAGAQRMYWHRRSTFQSIAPVPPVQALGRTGRSAVGMTSALAPPLVGRHAPPAAIRLAAMAAAPWRHGQRPESCIIMAVVSAHGP